MSIFSEKIPTLRQEEFKQKILSAFDARVNPKQYAFWEIRHPDFVATFYNSSKFVVQGRNITPVLETLQLSTETYADEQEYEVITVPHIGTDESGKGDFFGPLVTAGVFVDEKNRKLFEELGIRDSKTLRDDRILKMALEIQKHSVFSVIVLSNQKYNELYSRFKNLNRLLAWAHASVIENILEKTDCELALSDKFGDESLIQNALKTRGKQIRLVQRVRGESDIAVAAASVLARANFVSKMNSMQNFYKLDFSKGCSSNVKTEAKAFIQKYGKDRLIEVCKTHFKTYREI